jgi:hypothetical protein
MKNLDTAAINHFVFESIAIAAETRAVGGERLRATEGLREFLLTSVSQELKAPVAPPAYVSTPESRLARRRADWAAAAQEYATRSDLAFSRANMVQSREYMGAARRALAELGALFL